MSDPTPICNYWFIIIQGVPNTFLEYDGTSNFKRCTRCKGAFYLDQNAQKLHWKSHKKCCKLVGDDTLNTIANSHIDTCVIRGLSARLQNQVPSDLVNTVFVTTYTVYPLMKRLRTLMDDDVEGVSDAAYRLHTLARGLIFNTSDKLMMK